MWSVVQLNLTPVGGHLETVHRDLGEWHGFEVGGKAGEHW